MGAELIWDFFVLFWDFLFLACFDRKSQARAWFGNQNQEKIQARARFCISNV